MRLDISDEEFEKLVAEAIDSLPSEYLDKLDNVAFTFAELPSQEQLKKSEIRAGYTLFGLYEGMPKTSRGSNYNLVLPDKITIFKRPLLEAAHNTEHLKKMVRQTVWHEVAHHFGLGHGRIHELEKKSALKKQFQTDIDWIEDKALSKLHLTHAWFTRSGGVSGSVFESLNTGHYIGDRPENVEENLRRSMVALGLDRSRLVLAEQMPHGSGVLVATAQHAGRTVAGYDAMITNVADLPLAINVADCLPILIADKQKRTVGVIHAGWRGLIAGVIPETLKAMHKNYGTLSSELHAAIGPSITVDNYEVGGEVADKFPNSRREKDGKYFVDLQLEANKQLSEAGIDSIDFCDIDTFEDRRFYSYRRDSGRTGRFLSVISL